jgi:hypothetical protein
MKAWQKQERRLAASSGGTTTAGSGAFWTRKGDVRSAKFLIEGKQTDKASISVTKKIWGKIRREALLDGRLPVLALQIQDTRLVVIDEEDFFALTEDAVGESEVSSERGGPQ